MSYKKREIKTDEKTIAEFWEEYFKNEELIKKAFNHLHKRFPSENAMSGLVHERDANDAIRLDVPRVALKKTWREGRGFCERASF